MLLNERHINILESIKVPNTYWRKRNKTYMYWFRSLLHKIDSSIIFHNLPKEWSNDFFMLCLWALGFVAVFPTNRSDLKKFGSVVFQPANISGFDFYYQPEKAVISNPKYEAVLTVGKECELLKLTPDFMGVFDIIDFYASKLSELSKGIDQGLINTKLPLILTALNEAQAGTLKKVYDKIQEGEPLVIFKDELKDGDEIIPQKNPFEEWSQDFQKTYVVHNLLEDMQMILNSFYTEIGLPVAIEKKERLVTSEADFASAQSQARISCWLETLNESLEKINARYNLNISVEVSADERENDADRLGETS